MWTRTFWVIKHFPISNIISNYIVLGKGVRISWKNNFFGKIKIGDYSYIAWNCLILWSYNYWVTIWKFCSIASWVLFLAYNDHNASKLTTYPPYSWSVVLWRDEEVWSDIYISNDVWIWANVIILKWVEIGDWAIVWAWAVVTKSVPPYAIVWWNPAKIIKFRFPKEKINQLLESEWWNWSIEKIRENYNLEFIKW